MNRFTEQLEKIDFGPKIPHLPYFGHIFYYIYLLGSLTYDVRRSAGRGNLENSDKI